MGKRAAGLLLPWLCACGTTGQVPAALRDANVPDDATQPDAATGGPLASTPAGPLCLPGLEHIVVDDGTSVHVLTHACPGWTDAGVPTAMPFMEGEDGPAVVEIIGSGDDDAGCFIAAVETGYDFVPLTGTDMPANLEYGSVSIQGRMVIDDWPDAGGLVTGTYSGADTVPVPASLSGTFCVRRVTSW